MDLVDIGMGNLDWIGAARDRNRWRQTDRNIIEMTSVIIPLRVSAVIKCR
jgi:hypothetical protein